MEFPPSHDWDSCNLSSAFKETLRFPARKRFSVQMAFRCQAPLRQSQLVPFLCRALAKPAGQDGSVQSRRRSLFHWLISSYRKIWFVIHQASQTKFILEKGTRVRTISHPNFRVTSIQLCLGLVEGMGYGIFRAKAGKPEYINQLTQL